MNWIQRASKNDYLPWGSVKDKFQAIRGIENLNEWLTPTLNSCHSYKLLNNVEEAISRIKKAIDEKQSITISYDVDADGITAGTIMVDFLRQFEGLDLNIACHQREDGHGISKQTIEWKVDLLIVVDSSTNEIEECKKYKEKGIDVVILDHHKQEEVNPYAIVVNNNGIESKYPNKHLSGVGVTYKVLQGLQEIIHGNTLGHKYLDLVAIGLYADVMSMSELENRYFVHRGLNNIHNVGIQALFSVLKINKVNSDTIGFQIAPIINACARMNKIEMIIELLLMTDFDEAVAQSKLCIQENNERKKMQKKIMEDNEDKVDADKPVIMLEVNNIKKGYYGLVAMCLVEKYNKPAIVYANNNGVCRGSGRSVDGVDFNSHLNSTKLAKAEGHPGAFGVTFNESDIDTIQEMLEDKIRVAEKNIVYDVEYDYDEVDFNVAEEFEEVNFICGKDAPHFKALISNVLIENRMVLGGNKDTVKLCGKDLDMLKFRVESNYANDCAEKIDVVGQLCLNKWYDWRKRKETVTKQVLIDDYCNCL